MAWVFYRPLPYRMMSGASNGEAPGPNIVTAQGQVIPNGLSALREFCPAAVQSGIISRGRLPLW